MKCVFISCFNAYDNRIKLVEKFLMNNGYNCEYITSNFDHIKKDFFIVDRNNATQIEVKPYYKNLSIKRLISHYMFSKKALREVERIKPDMLYVMLPPNSLTWFASQYKKKHKVKLIFDIFDLWPETFPANNSRKILSIPFMIWKNLRNWNLGKADMIFTECGLFQEKLKYILTGKQSEILYLAKEKSNIESKPAISDTILDVCYLGSINNIIDIELISKLLCAINEIKPVKLHIIGDGENRKQFIESTEKVGVKVEFYGKIYEDQKKRQIFDKCSFGINMMKSSVCVGLSLKSIDYFQAGLPILNNIQADTANLVDKYGIGFNVSYETIDIVAKQISNIDIAQLLNMREKTNEVFQDIFSVKALEEKLQGIL